MATLKPRVPSELTLTASGSNASANLLNQAIGTDAVGLGIIAANASGPLGQLPSRGGHRGVMIVGDNRTGAADAYLARPEDIPSAGTETEPIGAMVFPAGSIVAYDDIDLANWAYILRALDGADITISVLYTGQGW